MEGKSPHTKEQSKSTCPPWLKCQSEKCSEKWHAPDKCSQNPSPKAAEASDKTSVDSFLDKAKLDTQSSYLSADAWKTLSQAVDNCSQRDMSSSQISQDVQGPVRERAETVTPNNTTDSQNIVQGSGISPIKVVETTREPTAFDQSGRASEDPWKTPSPPGESTDPWKLPSQAKNVNISTGQIELQGKIGENVQPVTQNTLHEVGGYVQSSGINQIPTVDPAKQTPGNWNIDVQATQTQRINPAPPPPSHPGSQEAVTQYAAPLNSTQQQWVHGYQQYWQQHYVYNMQQQPSAAQGQSNPSYHPNLTIQPSAMAQPPVPTQPSAFPNPTSTQPQSISHSGFVFGVQQQAAYQPIQPQNNVYQNTFQRTNPAPVSVTRLPNSIMYQYAQPPPSQAPQVNAAQQNNQASAGQGSSLLASAAQVANSIAFHYSHPNSDYNPYQPK